MGSIGRDLYDSFVRVRGFLLTLLSFILALAGFFVVKEQSIPLKWIILMACIVAIAGATLLDFAIRARHSAKQRLPSVIAVLSRSRSEGSPVLLLLEASDLFGHGALVSIYQFEDPFEVLIGIGYVYHVQENKKLQILVTEFIPERKEVWERIAENDTPTRNSLKVKPSVPVEQISQRSQTR